jgi:hypothetical protein
MVVVLSAVVVVWYSYYVLWKVTIWFDSHQLETHWGTTSQASLPSES